MSVYQGFGGLFSLGGVLDNSPIVNGALASGVATLAIDGTSLQGVIWSGDTFTLTGETGTPTHTVTGSTAYVVAGGSVTSVGFTPAVITGGVADDTAINFAANSVGNVRGWEVVVELESHDATTFGDKWKRFVGGRGGFTGSADLLLDYGDSKQAALLDKIYAATPVVASVGFVFQTASGKRFYGAALVQNFTLGAPVDGLITVSAQLVGDGAFITNWV